MSMTNKYIAALKRFEIYTFQPSKSGYIPPAWLLYPVVISVSWWGGGGNTGIILKCFQLVLF